MDAIVQDVTAVKMECVPVMVIHTNVPVEDMESMEPVYIVA